MRSGRQVFIPMLVLYLAAMSEAVLVTEEGFCTVNSLLSKPTSKSPYWKVMNPTLIHSHFEDLPGFTRSVYRRDHALISPESHVYSALPHWENALGAYLISPALGSHFAMYLVKMQEDSRSALPEEGIERFIFVLQGNASLSVDSGITHQLNVEFYAYLPSNTIHHLKTDSAAMLVIFERRYNGLNDGFTIYPEVIIGSTDNQPLLDTPGEVFELRKLLPTSIAYDFNIHVMDFQPGEYLNVKEVHYNQHGLLLLEGQGIYRLGDN